MFPAARFEVQDNDPVKALEAFMGAVLAQEEIGAVLVPRHLPGNALVMPVLVSDAAQLAGTDPLAPCFALNGARMVSRLTRKALDEKIAVMLRPCEIRAFVELVKLNQGRRDGVIIIGTDCLGAYSNKEYMQYKKALADKATPLFCQSILTGEGITMEGLDLVPACKACEAFLPEGADLAVALFGVDISSQLLVQAQTQAGESLLQRLRLPTGTMPAQRPALVEALRAERLARRDKMTAETAGATDSLEKLGRYLAGCVNCYNCRVACPVCYCRECVFVTDVFDHEPTQYLGWARRRGALKMPTDTVFYHLTRMAHMSTACVGCGQCSNACPNGVGVMELFRTVALRTQSAFGYEPGRRLEDRPPLSEFKEQEFEEVVGIE